MSLFVIDQDICQRDGICVAACPLGIIEIGRENAFPSPIEGAEELCINCGHCVSICPPGALSLKTMKPQDCQPVQRDLVLSPEKMDHFLRSRRSIRQYQAMPVDRQILTELLEIAQYAPSGRNLQPVHWLVIEEAREMRLLSTLVLVAHSPKTLTLAQTACIIGLAHLEIAALSRGLGACWAGYFIAAAAHHPPLTQALDLPEGYQCFGAMMIGYPKYHYQRIPLRNEPKISWR